MLPPKTAEFARQRLIQRMQSLLDGWALARREPDVWASYFLDEAIGCFSRGAFVQAEGHIARAQNPNIWPKPEIQPPDPLTIAQLRARLLAASESV
jgi:hypothetical protein